MHDGFVSIAAYKRWFLTGKRMASRRDWLLQQLGVTPWILHRPAVLQGEIAIRLPDDIRLLIVARSFPEHDDPLLGDVLHSLDLTPRQIYPLTPEQVTMLPKNIRCNSWRLGVSEPLVIEGAQLHSPALAELYQNVNAKRALWQQICEYEKDFYPDAK